MEKTVIITRYSEEVKKAAVNAVEELGMTVVEACKCYHVNNRRSVDRWRKKYGRNNRPSKVVRVIMKSEQERIMELESLVSDLSVKCKVLNAQVEIYEEITGDDNKKKLSTKRLRELEENKQRLLRMKC